MHYNGNILKSRLDYIHIHTYTYIQYVCRKLQKAYQKFRFPMSPCMSVNGALTWPECLHKGLMCAGEAGSVCCFVFGQTGDV